MKAPPPPPSILPDRIHFKIIRYRRQRKKSFWIHVIMFVLCALIKPKKKIKQDKERMKKFSTKKQWCNMPLELKHTQIFSCICFKWLLFTQGFDFTNKLFITVRIFYLNKNEIYSSMIKYAADKRWALRSFCVHLFALYVVCFVCSMFSLSIFFFFIAMANLRFCYYYRRRRCRHSHRRRRHFGSSLISFCLFVFDELIT